MAIRKIGKKWYSDIEMPCFGVDCRTPHKSLPHKHRRRKALGPSAEYAAIKAADMQKGKLAEKYGQQGDMSWLYFKEKFLPYSKDKNPQTHYRDTLAVRYLEKYFDIQKLTQITPELLRALKTKLKEGGKKDQNINRVLSALKAMMRFAEGCKYIPPQIWRMVKLYETPKGRLLYWKEEEIEKIYRECRGIWKTVAMLAIEAGLRREEIHTLKVENVDFVRKRIHIVGDETWHPKDYERRWVPMKEPLRAYLKANIVPGVYVLGDDRPNLDVMTTYFRKIVRRALLNGSLHTGRHTYGSHLAMKGIPLAVIKERMGHASIRTTEIYAHLCADKTQELYAA